MTATDNQNAFERNGINFVAVESECCLDCALYHDASCYDGQPCLSLYRDDGRNIIWVKEEK